MSQYNTVMMQPIFADALFMMDAGNLDPGQCKQLEAFYTRCAKPDSSFTCRSIQEPKDTICIVSGKLSKCVEVKMYACFEYSTFPFYR